MVHRRDLIYCFSKCICGAAAQRLHNVLSLRYSFHGHKMITPTHRCKNTQSVAEEYYVTPEIEIINEKYICYPHHEKSIFQTNYITEILTITNVMKHIKEHTSTGNRNTCIQAPAHT